MSSVKFGIEIKDGMVSQDMSRRILTCEKRELESVKVSYEDLVMWSDIVGDAIEVINDKGGSHGR